MTKVYENGTVANRNISFEVVPGEILGVFGPNGSGKTTLIRQMVGLLRPSAGSILLMGSDLSKRPDMVPQHVGYLGQSESGFSAFTFRELIVHAGVHRGLTPRQACTEADELIGMFGCSHIAGTLRFRLSGGERRLSLLLSALIAQRSVLVLDEPTNELDPSHRTLVWQYLLAHSKDRGVSIVLVTHNVLEAETVVDRVAIIHHGLLIAIGTPGELKAEFGDSARVEITVRAGAEAYLPAEAERIHGQKWRMVVSRMYATQLFNDFAAKAGSDAIDDFRITSVSLEDVYGRLTRRADALSCKT